MKTASPISWNAPDTANELLSPRFNSHGCVDFVLVELDLNDPQSGGVLGVKFAQARYTVDSQGNDVWLTAEPSPRRLYGVVGWALAQ
ncbi:hypothetical protein [Burkholderia sp. Ac-20365]|jgi:hypothetical protein|uniref:hypothetical protein n=1 Tax=Burkholderia sp. Ac-20365 TaxID=2703897 RepID=UPI00197B8D8A|nr:hypothetical protein [Burkholderia sp. Ac-20365]MBN3763405.1 hypothetical protein [Burkholderia sp. Ac-20365]